MSSLTYSCITDLRDAERTWKALSPNLLLFDDWKFRYGYYKYFLYPIRFYAAYDDEELVGLLPLMWNAEKRYLEFFTSFGYMENNSAFVKPGYEYCIPQLIQQIDKPALLEYMSPSSHIIPGTISHDNEYYADLKGLKDYHEFLDVYMTGDKKRNLLSQFKRLEQLDLQISLGTHRDINYLIYLSKLRFGTSSSFYKRPHFDKFVHFVGTQFDSRIVTARVNGKIEGVGMVVLYKDICFGITSGYNPEISNLGKYISIQKIDIAIKAGKNIYAAGTGSPNWKEDFNLLKKPQFQLDLRNRSVYGQYNIPANL